MSIERARSELLESDEERRGRLNLSMRQLRVFTAVYRERSVTDAADTLLLSQPTVSRALRSLESRLGVDLFERSWRGLEPTPAADLLNGHAMAALDEIDSAVARIRDSDARAGLRIGVASCLLMFAAPAAKIFIEANPTVIAEVQFGESAMIVGKVEAEQLDLAVVAALPSQIPGSLLSTRIGEVQQALHCPQDIREKGSLALPAAGSWDRTIIDEKATGTTPPFTVTTTAGAASKQLLRGGYAVHIPVECGADVPDVDVVGDPYAVGIYALMRSAPKTETALQHFIDTLGQRFT